jgi:hypothetical protein
VSPIEIEHAVARHPDLAEAAVIGVQDALMGELPVAFVVPRPGASPTEDDLRRFCREHMPAYQVPVRFTLVDALPRNEAGKLLRAELAARAALCGGDQGKYWAVHDALFAWSGELSPETLKARAEDLGLRSKEFAACVDESRHAEVVAADQALGQRLGVQGTPNFFLGKVDPADPQQVELVRRIPGAVGYPVFSTALDALLAEKKN